MRRTLTLCRTGLAGAAAFVLLTACGGGDDTASSSSSSASETTTSSSSETGAAADTEFCQQAASLNDALAGLGNVQDPAQFGTILQQLADKLHQLDPPAEIESDWTGLVGGIDQLAQAAAQTDFTDQNQAAAFAQTANQLESQLGTASTSVETYLSDQCGIDADSTDSAAPTS